MWHNWVNVKRNYFTQWRIYNAKMGAGLLSDALRRKHVEKKMMNMILSSTLGKLVSALKGLRDHNNELKALYGDKVEKVKFIINTFQNKTVVGLQNQCIKKLRAHNRDEIKKEKIMKALLKSSVFQTSETLQR